MCYLTGLMLAAGLALGDDPAKPKATPDVDVPERVLKQMAFLVGEWEWEGTMGAVPFRGIYEVRWGPGQRFLLVHSWWDIGGKRLTGSGVSGWDAQKKRLVECSNATGSNAGTSRIEYDLDQDPSAWPGTFRQVATDGTVKEGRSRLEIGQDTLRTVGTAIVDGREEKTVGTARKVRPGDGQKAFRELADLLVGGVWVCEHPKVGRVEHTYDWKIPGRVMECVQQGGDGPRVMTVAVDPANNRVTWWTVREDGAVNTMTARPTGKDAWRLNAEDLGPRGPQTLEATMVRKSPDEIHITVDRAAPDPDKVTGLVEVYKRQRPGAGEASAEDYLAFWKKYFVGDWDQHAQQGEGKETPGVWSCRPGPNGKCMVFTGTLNGKATDPTLGGYDPRTRSWKEVTYLLDGSLLTIHWRVPLAVLRGDPKGQVLKGQSELVTPEGQVQRGDNEVRIRDDDHWSGRVTNIVRDGVKQPDLAIESIRRKK